MKLFKIAKDRRSVVEVEGEPWPGRDSEGAECFDNTHFETRALALEALKRDAELGVIFAGEDVQRAKQQLLKEETAAGIAAERFAAVSKYLESES